MFKVVVFAILICLAAPIGLVSAAVAAACPGSAEASFLPTCCAIDPCDGMKPALTAVCASACTMAVVMPSALHGPAARSHRALLPVARITPLSTINSEPDHPPPRTS